MNGEQPIRPYLELRPAAAAGQRLERVDGVFVAIFGVDGLASAEIDSRSVDPRLLPPCRGEMHLDPVVRAVVEGVMLEGAEIEVGAELAVDARQEIEIEFRRDTLGVVVGVVENFGILHQIDADYEQDRKSVV